MNGLPGAAQRRDPACPAGQVESHPLRQNCNPDLIQCVKPGFRYFLSKSVDTIGLCAVCCVHPIKAELHKKQLKRHKRKKTIRDGAFGNVKRLVKNEDR